MDIKPPKNWKRPDVARPTEPSAEVSTIPEVQLPPVVEKASEVPILSPVSLPGETGFVNQPQRKRRRWLSITVGIVGLLVVVAAAAFGWYSCALMPRDSNASLQAVTIDQGMTPRSIAQLLEDKQIIRSKIAFELYASIGGYASSLQAGNYKLSASQSVADIVDHLTKGANDVYNVTILPGLTLQQLADPNVKKSLVAQGFSVDEVTAAFAASYSSPVLADRPAGASLEGYIFPETYQVRVGDSLESLIQRSLDELYSRIQAGALPSKFTEHGLTIHQAITLASIVQKEVSNPGDQPQVAQVFLKRLADGIMLGSDVTALYGAKIDGISLPSNAGEAAVIAINHDSPYNTRKYAGMPPGPIANMNFSALEAIANPAAGDYLYFVAGDDGRTYFSRTNEEHEAATAAHCKTLCSQ